LHATWHGLTPTDLIFPFFLFIVGISIYFAYKRSENLKMNDSILFLSILLYFFQAHFMSPKSIIKNNKVTR
jgi:predicted acyltransferase